MKKAAGTLLFASTALTAAFFVLFAVVPSARATDFSSTNFTVKDPVISDGAGYSTSNSFRLWSNVGQLSIGTSTSAAFGVNAGFLYFPEPSPAPTPTPTPTPTAEVSTGLGSYLPLPPSPPPAPGLIPAIGEFIAQIVGEPPGIVKCGRADYNCDGKVNLKDLSIFFSFPRRVNTRNLSLVFADWTDRLLRFGPEPGTGIAEAPPGAGRAGERIRRPIRPPLAQIGEIVRPAPPAEPREPRVGILKRILQFFTAILRFLGRIFGL